MNTLTTTVITPRTLMAMTRDTLTRPLLMALITSANRYEWASAERIEELVELLSDPVNMRKFMYYALPTERERVLTMHMYGLAGCILEPHELAEFMTRKPDTQVTESMLPRLELLIREHLSVVFGMTAERLDEVSQDFLACLDLEDRTRLALYRLEVRQISQLTALTLSEFRALGLSDALFRDVRRALAEKKFSFR
jgi:hypothetical protein